MRVFPSCRVGGWGRAWQRPCEAPVVLFFARMVPLEARVELARCKEYLEGREAAHITERRDILPAYRVHMDPEGVALAMLRLGVALGEGAHSSRVEAATQLEEAIPHLMSLYSQTDAEFYHVLVAHAELTYLNCQLRGERVQERARLQQLVHAACFFEGPTDISALDMKERLAGAWMAAGEDHKARKMCVWLQRAWKELELPCDDIDIMLEELGSASSEEEEEEESAAKRARKSSPSSTAVPVVAAAAGHRG